jgi:antitoxin (DNA-binding transcriptional repressor) of toxin-antitoxin stability system
MKETRISTTDLARSVGEIIARVRFRGESFIIERHGKEVARLIPPPDASRQTLQSVAEAWREAGAGDEPWVRLLEEIGGADRPLEDPWESSSTPAR